jgi:hypothetical protein
VEAEPTAAAKRRGKSFFMGLLDEPLKEGKVAGRRDD